MTKKIIIDTNFLMIPFALKVDIFSEIDRIILDKYQIYALDKTIIELENIIKKQSGRNKLSAKFALELIKDKKIKMIKTDENGKDVDSDIIDLLAREDYILATNDKLLRYKIKNLNRQIIILRQKRYLVLV